MKSLVVNELDRVDKQERLNIFRRYFAASRYNRLVIQQLLIRAAMDGSLVTKVKKLERDHYNDFIKAVRAIKKSAYFEEFLSAIKEEDMALQKIIEAYDKRMNSVA
jgi:hypothetical protein